MNNLKDLKKSTLFILFFTIIPFGKFLTINGYVVLLDLYLAVTGQLTINHYIFLTLLLIGVYLIIFKKGFLTLVGYGFTFLWLGYKIEFADFTGSYYVSISNMLYVVLSSYVCFRILKNLKEEQ